MEHSLHALRADRLSLWEGFSTSGLADDQDTCITPKSVATSAVSGDGVMTGASCS